LAGRLFCGTLYAMNDATDHLAPRLEFARRIAREAGQITLRYFQSDALAVDRKSDDSPVTVADREAEQHLRGAIAERFADDAILGEEFGERAGTSGYRWILDPIDGTKSFIHGAPLYTTLVGVEHEGRGVVGVIYAPATDEMVSAAVGQGAWYVRQGGNPRRAQVSSVETLSAGLFLTTEIASFTKHRQPDAVDVYLQLQNQSRLARTWGDAYGYLMVAVGRAEAMLDPEMNLWDAAAIQPILEEAGGTFTDWRGEPTIHGGEGVATNRCVLEEVLAVTRGR
jgi:histidinol phosphatase-like enzyme (inositol monophosphatase family)